MTKYRWMGKSGHFLTHAKEYDFSGIDGQYASFTDDTLTTHSWTVKTMLRDGWEIVSDSPTRTETVTTRRIEPGVYGRWKVSVFPEYPGVVGLALRNRVGGAQKSGTFNAPELRELARVALELAEFLDA